MINGASPKSSTFRHYYTTSIVRGVSKVQRVSNTNCYSISENARIATQTLLPEEALRATVGHGLGALLAFGNPKLVLYEGETVNIRYISKPEQPRG